VEAIRKQTAPASELETMKKVANNRMHATQYPRMTRGVTDFNPKY
jgi:hypothetical protein